MATAQQILDIARGEIGYSRWNDPAAGTKYGRWYADLVGNSYYGQSGVPYCAMFASWVFAQAGATCAGLPGAYTPTMLQAASNAGKTVNKYDAQPGDVIYFNWDGGEVDHVGIVEQNCGSYVQTIEGNTGNGEVLRRTRNWSTVAGVVRPNWNEEDIVTPQDKQDIVNMILNAPLVSAHDGQTYPVSAYIVGTNDASWTAASELTRLDDPTGRDQYCNIHDHQKWIAKVLQDVNQQVQNIQTILEAIQSELETQKEE